MQFLRAAVSCTAVGRFAAFVEAITIVPGSAGIIVINSAYAVACTLIKSVAFKHAVTAGKSFSLAYSYLFIRIFRIKIVLVSFRAAFSRAGGTCFSVLSLVPACVAGVKVAVIAFGACV